MFHRASSLLFTFIILIAGLFCVTGAMAQEFRIEGRVMDAETAEPLAFVNILASDGKSGAMTDIDGKFLLRSLNPVTSLRFSYVGYQGLELSPDLEGNLMVRLKKLQIELPEVLIRPGINPADQIIRQVFENRYLNDHEHLEAFSYTSYEKTTFGPETDSLPGIDSLLNDSVYMRMKNFFDSQHLFLMEAVTNRSFMFPGKEYNRVIASRVSGFADPLFVFLISQLQSTSFYDEVIRIGDKQYINPVSFGSTRKYYFQIEDTLLEPYPCDTTYILSYRPLMNTNFESLKGMLSVSTNGYAIRNVIAEPFHQAGGMTIRIQQLYDFIDSTHWFPVQLNTDIIFRNAIGRGNVEVDVSSGEGTAPKPGRHDLVGRGKSYISDIRLNPALKRNQFGFVELDVAPDAYRQQDKVWDSYRINPLTAKDSVTYKRIDSIGKSENFDRLGYRLDAVLNGKVPVGFVDLVIDKVLMFNPHERIRLGLGVQTNSRLSERFGIGGYGAYGILDGKFKYGGDIRFMFDKTRQLEAMVSALHDVAEPGAADRFIEGRNLFNPEKFRQLLIYRMDEVTEQRVSLGGRVLNFLHADAVFSRSLKHPLYDYGYLVAGTGELEVTRKTFQVSEASLLLRYAYNEKFLRNSRSTISLGTKYPVVWLSFVHGFSGLLGGQYTYNRFDLRVNYSFFTKYLGTTLLSLQAGCLDRDLPYPLLYNAKGSYRPLAFYSPCSFATMRLGEFASDRYAALFMNHKFGKLLYRSKYFNPQPELVTNIGFGALREPANHLRSTISSFTRGYFESGLLINNLLNISIVKIGAGALYRYGYYAFPTFRENIAWKLTAEFAF